MSDDPIEWLKTELDVAKRYGIDKPTPSRMANDFLRFDATQRSQKLAHIDKMVRNSHLSLEDAAKVHAYRRALVNAHQAASKVNR